LSGYPEMTERRLRVHENAAEFITPAVASTPKLNGAEQGQPGQGKPGKFRFAFSFLTPMLLPRLSMFPQIGNVSSGS
jgi:hypothetical protein